jgi:ribosomal protein L40E
MPKETDAEGASLQRELQPGAPDASTGVPPRPALANSDPAPNAPQTANVPAPAPPSPGDSGLAAPWLSTIDGPQVQTELSSLRPCTRCNAPIPVGARSCPSCHCFAPGGRARRPRKGDVEAIHASLLAEYVPQTTVLKETCGHLAAAYAELKTIPAGSLEWQRILNITQELSANLEASRPPQPTPSDEFANLSNAEAIPKLREKLARTAKMLDLIEHGHQLDVEHEALVAAERTPSQPEGVIGPSQPEAPIEEQPEPRCPYGCGTLAKCAEIKATRPDTWEVLHGRDPEVIRKKDEAATAEMKFMLGKRNPYL